MILMIEFMMEQIVVVNTSIEQILSSSNGIRGDRSIDKFFKDGRVDLIAICQFTFVQPPDFKHMST